MRKIRLTKDRAPGVSRLTVGLAKPVPESVMTLGIVIGQAAGIRT